MSLKGHEDIGWVGFGKGISLNIQTDPNGWDPWVFHEDPIPIKKPSIPKRIEDFLMGLGMSSPWNT